MKEFFDTSVLVAVFWGDHPRHEASLRIFARATPSSAACASHSLAEVYAVLTRLPVRPPILPEQAWLHIEQIARRLALLTLEPKEFERVLRNAAEHGVTGGSIYDALLLGCARKSNADRIYTWNVADFQRLASDLAGRIRTP